MGKRKLKTISDLYSKFSLEEQEEATKNVQNYLRVVKKIYDRLRAEGRLDEVMLRGQWEKRNHKNPALQNIN